MQLLYNIGRKEFIEPLDPAATKLINCVFWSINEEVELQWQFYDGVLAFMVCCMAVGCTLEQFVLHQDTMAKRNTDVNKTKKK